MNSSLIRITKLLLGLFCLLLSTSSCQKDELLGEVLIYENDFSEDTDLSEIKNGRTTFFNNETVLGNYNNEEISFSIEGIPDHNLVRVNIELLLHDSWDGNVTGLGGPDYWYLIVDNQQILKTTFSNSPCVSSHCLYQSYPEQYGTHNNPKTGALETKLPGLCQYKDVPGWTSKYRISKILEHKSTNIYISMGDLLKQENANSAICDESWSLSNIKISALNIK